MMYDLPIVLEDYLNYMETIRGSSPATVQEYLFDLRIFLKFLKLRYKLVDPKIDFDKIDISDIDIDLLNKVTIQDLHAFIGFVDRQRNNGVSAKSRKVASLKSFFQYLFTTIEVINKNPASALEFPKTESRHPVYLSLEQSKSLLDAVLDNPNEEMRLRDYAIITLFLNCGLRLSELTSINISKIKDDNTMSVIGKGNKERTVFLNKACVSAIENYIKVRPYKTNNPDALFISRNKNRISNRAVQNLVDKYLEKANLDTDIYSTHTLRHTAATLMYKHGNVDIRALQEVLGHESVSTTQIYTHTDSERLKKAVDKNPLSDF